MKTDCVLKEMYFLMLTVKPVLRGSLWDKEKWYFKTGDLLKEVHFRRHFLYTVKPVSEGDLCDKEKFF